MQQILYKRTRTVIRNWGDKFVADLKRQLNVDKTVASGRTRESIEGKFQANNEYIKYEISSRANRGVSILEVIDQGRGRGGFPPVSAIMYWMERKGVRPRTITGQYKKSSATNLKRSAFLIARAIANRGTIKRYGYRGSGVMDFVFKKNEDKMTTDVVNAFDLDLQDYIDENVKPPRTGRR